MEELKFVVFRLGEQKYGMNLAHINGIEQDYHIIPVPNAPENIRGIINLRGEVIPVYNLREYFGMESQTASLEKNLLVTRSSNVLLAYEVDAVIGIEEVQSENINDMPRVASNSETELMDRVLHIGNEIVIAINVDKVLSEDMQVVIGQMIADNK